MPIAPVPNTGSQLERAIRALFVENGAGTYDQNFVSNDWRTREAPLNDIVAHKSTESIIHSRAEAFVTRIEAEWPGTNQPGATDPDWNWVQINQWIGRVMACLSLTDNGGQDYSATAYAISAAGRRLAVIGANPTEIANNSDMVSFYCTQVEFKGSTRAEQNSEGLYFKEVRHFEITACNLVDKSVFPLLVFAAPHTLNWSFDLGYFPDPVKWIVQNSVDGVLWVDFTVVDGDVLTCEIAGQATKFWRVFRSTDGEVRLLPESNAVRAVVP